jgi:hypothetical protein
MPFKSEAQRRYLWANEPDIARDWADTYGSRIQKENGGIMRLGFQNGNDVDNKDKTFWERLKGAKDYLSNMAWSMPFSPMGIFSMIAGKADRFHTLPGIDQEFITNQMQAQGTDPVSGLYQDPFGKNIRSLFGNYADYNVNRLEKLNQILHRKRLEDPGFMWKPTSFLGKEYKYRQGLDQEQQGIKTRIQDQLSDAAKRQEAAGGDAGYTLSQLQDPGPKGDYAAARERTASRVGPGGKMRAYGLARGGLASLWQE